MLPKISVIFPFDFSHDFSPDLSLEPSLKHTHTLSQTHRSDIVSLRASVGAKIPTYQLRPCDSNAEILGILLHLLEGNMHRSDVHVGNVDGHLGDVLLRQPPANSLNCLQSAGLVISPALFSDIQSNPEPNP